MADRTLTTVLRAQTAPFDGPMLQSARVMEKFEKDARAMSRFVNQAFGQLQTPSEKLELNLQKLDAVFKQGKISAEEHGRAVQKLTADYNRATTAAIELAKAEQNARIMGRFNESRASLFTGESRQDLMARMSGGAAAPGTPAAAGESGSLLGGLGGAIRGGAALMLAKKTWHGLGEGFDEMSKERPGTFNQAGGEVMAGAHKDVGSAIDVFGILSKAFTKRVDELSGGSITRLAQLRKDTQQMERQRDAWEQTKRDRKAVFEPEKQFAAEQRMEEMKRGGVSGLQMERDLALSSGKFDEARAAQQAIVDLKREAVALERQGVAAAEAHARALHEQVFDAEREGRVLERMNTLGESRRVAEFMVQGGTAKDAEQLARQEKFNAEQQKILDRRNAKGEDLGDLIADQVQEAMKRAAEQVKQVDAFQRQFENPEEQFKRQEREIKRMEAAGLSPEFAKRAREANDDEFRRSARRTNQQLAPLLVAGSREAINFLNQQKLSESDPALAKADEQIKLMRDQLDQQKEQVKALDEMKEKGTVMQIANF